MSYIIELTFYFQFSNILLQENLLLPLKKPQGDPIAVQQSEIFNCQKKEFRPQSGTSRLDPMTYRTSSTTDSSITIPMELLINLETPMLTSLTNQMNSLT